MSLLNTVRATIRRKWARFAAIQPMFRHVFDFEKGFSAVPKSGAHEARGIRFALLDDECKVGGSLQYAAGSLRPCSFLMWS